MAGPGGTAFFTLQTQDFATGLQNYQPVVRMFSQTFPSISSTIVTTFYILSGYYAAGNVRERWVGASPTSSPPSGHTLTGIDVEGFWTTTS